MVDVDKLKDPSPWIPEKDPHTLAVLGKLLEEVNELGSALARAVIQGIDGVHPVTGKPVAEWIAEEIADVEAGLRLTKPLISYNERNGQLRTNTKEGHLLQWHKLIEAAK